SEHHSATHAVFLTESRVRLKYGIDLALGFDFPMEIKPDWENERRDLPTLSCLNSTCFGFSKTKGSASVTRKWTYHEAPIRGSSFNITFCPKQKNGVVDDDDDYLED
ncbi:hypothetical protein PMAYCL1PPCAC_27648, partial [Pristionchus mayeri]